MFDNLQIGTDWEQFTNIFVLDIVLICVLDPNPPKPFVVMWGIGRHEFHIVLYFLCNFHQKFIFSDMGQCPFETDGGC